MHFTKHISLFSFSLTIFLLPATAQPSGGSVNQWVWQQIHVGNAYHTFIPVKKIKVAIIDGAFDLDHPALKEYIGGNEKEIPGNNIDDDKNGLIDDATGWDFADGDNDVMPQPTDYSDALHGTRVADIFLQVIDQLVPGALGHIFILPLKTKSDKANNNYITAGYSAMEYAIAQHVDIILCCWGGTMISADQKKILQKASDAGIIIVATAGNFYFNEPQYPGAFDNVICVTAVTKSVAKQAVANYGRFTDIAAPGDSIMTIGSRSLQRLSAFSGTSAAAPVVAGVVAAIKAAGYTGNAKAIDRLLKNSATPLDEDISLYAGKLGAGLLNIAALAALLRGADHAMLYMQPQAYIGFNKLSRQVPVRVVAAAKYKDYKFSCPSPAGASAANIRFRSFNNGIAKETIWKRAMLNRPVFITADSVYIFNTVSAARPVPARFIYYEAETIDSAYFYCSGTVRIKDSEGIIEDGSGGNNYTGRNDCRWLIEVPQGKRISIDFEAFDTEAKKDQVYIFNGSLTNAPILAIFSGPAIPPHVQTAGNIALVWFVTTETVHGKGWKMHYKAID